MPQFLEQRFGSHIGTLMAVFWIALYVFVNLTSILWLGSLAIAYVSGMDQMVALVALAVFALAYQLYGGLKAVALTDVVQVTLLVLGGLLLAGITLNEISNSSGIIAGLTRLQAEAPGHFKMILSPDNPFYKDLPGLGVLLAGLWVMHCSYWGFNQYISQRALAAKNIGEAQKGLLFAAGLKILMPVIVVLPGLAALMLAPDLPRADAAYPSMMALLPTGVLGAVFAALIAAVVSSLASMTNSISTIFTMDLYARFGRERSQKELVRSGRTAGVVSMAIAIAAVLARPLLGSSDQAFQAIQNYTGYFTPGIVAIFLMGLLWKRANEAGALAAALRESAAKKLLPSRWSITAARLLRLAIAAVSQAPRHRCPAGARRGAAIDRLSRPRAKTRRSGPWCAGRRAG